MTTNNHHSAAFFPTGKENMFPLIRLLSRPMAAVVAHTPVTPNMVTVIGVVCGLGAAWCFLHIGSNWAMIGAGLFFLSYLFDNVDGDLARLRKMTSRLGAALDDIGDWLVHLAFFLAVGYQMTQTTGQPLWAWLGVAAALGGTINSVLPLFHRAGADAEEVASFADLSADATWVDLVGFFFRGLVKADFWLIVLALALADMLWVLLPAAAVGTQVFWMPMLRKSLRTVHT